MTRGVLFSLCLPLLACNPAVVGGDAGVENLPLHTHDLQISPGCYVNQPTLISQSGGGVNGGSDFLEMNASYNMQIMMLLNRLVQDDPTAEHWEIESRQLDGSGFAARIEARFRGERSSQFEITLNATRPVFGSPVGSPPRFVDTTTIGYGTATPHTTTVDYGSLVYRWSDYAHEIRMVQPVPVSDGNVLRWERRVVSQLRGCDPDTLVSFSNNSGEAIACWSIYGSPTDCTHVNLWP